MKEFKKPIVVAAEVRKASSGACGLSYSCGKLVQCW